jgi:hypothetical protein
MFARDKYYSLTDIQKKFKISRGMLQLLLDKHNPPVIENRIQFGNYYGLIAKYYLKEDIDKIIN